MRHLLSLLPAILILCGCGGMPSGSSGLKVSAGDSMPAFSLETVDGQPFESADLAGSAAVVTIFATWCGPCVQELRALETEIWQPLQDQGVSIVAINAGQEDQALIEEFVQEHGLTFPVLIDEDGSFGDDIGGNSIPRSLVVDSQGKIVATHVGYSPASLEQIKSELTAFAPE